MKTESSTNGQHEDVNQYRRGTATAVQAPNRLAKPDADDSSDQEKKQSLFRRPGVIIIVAALGIVGISYGAFAMFHSFTHESTDEAFIDVHFVSVAPKIAGHVIAAHVDDNQLVKKGDVLVEIDPSDFQVALAQAKANLAKDKATKVQAELNEKRALDLFSQKVISPQERDTNVAAAESSRASVHYANDVRESLFPKSTTNKPAILPAAA
jgi:membrane fusion protein (multidrug efflux system)